MSAKAASRSSDDEKFSDEQSGYRASSADPDAEFGGTEARRILEKKLLWKVDCRMSVLVLIYILNYVSFLTSIMHAIEMLMITFFS